MAAGELLDTLPPGIDEAVAISKVVQFLKSPEYSHFQHIVFDTAPTGHTLRLLTLPDFLDKTIGSITLVPACMLPRRSGTRLCTALPLSSQACHSGTDAVLAQTSLLACLHPRFTTAWLGDNSCTGSAIAILFYLITHPTGCICNALLVQFAKQSASCPACISLCMTNTWA